MRIVLFRTDKIGDLIVSTPVIAGIRAKHKDAKIMLVASPYNAVVADGLSEIDEVVLLQEDGPLQQKIDARKKIRAFAPTHALVMSPKHECYLASLLSGAKKNGWIIMEYRPLAKLAAAFFIPSYAREEIPRTFRSLHHSEHILRLARRMGLVDADEYPYLVGRKKDADEKMAALLKEKGLSSFIAVHVVDKWLEEEWRIEHVRDFLKQAQQETGLPIVLTAGPADKILSAGLENDFPCFKNLGFAEWVAVLGQARMVFTPDCSAVHIACALKKPLLAIYQAARYERAVTEYGPQGTVFRARPLAAPNEQIKSFLHDIKQLLATHP